MAASHEEESYRFSNGSSLTTFDFAGKMERLKLGTLSRDPDLSRRHDSVEYICINGCLSSLNIPKISRVAAIFSYFRNDMRINYDINLAMNNRATIKKLAGI